MQSAPVLSSIVWALETEVFDVYRRWLNQVSPARGLKALDMPARGYAGSTCVSPQVPDFQVVLERILDRNGIKQSQPGGEIIPFGVRFELDFLEPVRWILRRAAMCCHQPLSVHGP